MRTKYRSHVVATTLCTLLALFITQSVGGAVQWRWTFDRYDTGNLKFFTPDRIQYYSGLQYNSQGGSWGCHIYGSTDPYWQDQNTINGMNGYYVGSDDNYIPAVKFDVSQTGNLHATGWYYAPNYANPTYSTEDDDQNGRHEEARLSSTLAVQAT